MPSKVSRLFEAFQPSNYGLKIDIDKPGKTFSGTVVIFGKKVGRPSQRISLHQKNLKIKSAKIVKNTKFAEEELKISRINQQKSFDELRIHSESMIYPGDYTVTVEFSGKISDTMVGLYPCYFKNEGVEDWLIATQFESHHAREAFPCIDEPEAKATFDLTVITDKNAKVLSNTPEKNFKISGNTQEVSFETTPIMSSYLLAWVLGDIHSVEGKTKDGIIVKSWAAKTRPKEFLNFANNEAISHLEFFGEYFKTPFPLKKLDQIALPDFEVGAMENWGLVTYREAAMLSDPENRSISTEQYVSMVVAHELSHQWFGNLVTMKWWDDLWLNESFASIMEHIALDNLHPDWEQWETFTSSDVIAASNRDNYKDVQAVSVEINHPDEIHTIFDGAIVYAKGARLLKMLFDYIGEDAMREGLKSYFKKYAYKNTVRNDLWKELGESSKKDIDRLMTPWLIKSGMPELKVTLGNNKLQIQQERFLLDGEDKKSLWPIPLLADTKLPIDILSDRSIEIDYSNASEPILNINGSGHFIVNYADKKTKSNVKQKIVDQKIPATGRINALNDMMLLAQAGHFDLTDIVDIADECAKEPRDAVWSMLARSIGYAQLLTDGDEEAEKQIKKLKVELASYWHDKLGWDDSDDDNPNTKLLRQTALALTISGEEPKAVNIALDKFNSTQKLDDLPAEQRGLIASAAVKFTDSNKSIVESLKKQYTESTNPDIQQAITSALTSTKSIDQAKEIIEWGLKEKGAVRPQDLTRWFIQFMRNRHTRDAAWEWLKQNWDERYEELGGAKTLPYFVRFSANTITTDVRYREFKNFFEPKLSDAGLKRDIKVAFALIESQIEWRKREELKLKKYLQKYS